MAQPTARDGKPLNIADGVTVVGNITSISGNGNTASVTVQLLGSGTSVVVQGQDCAASTQTL